MSFTNNEEREGIIAVKQFQGTTAPRESDIISVF